MKVFILLFCSVLSLKIVNAQQDMSSHEILNLSKKKWLWMADKNVDSLTPLFHEKSKFIHMGGTWGKEQELNIIKSGGIWYKKAEVYNDSVNIIGNTAIVLNDIDLEAVVGGNTVVNPFMVTEVYIKEKDKWKMGSLTFSRLVRPVKMVLPKQNTSNSPLVIQEQGSFAVGGTVITNPGMFDPYKPTPAGQTFHGDHAYVFYQKPVSAKKYPLVMWHGIGQFSKTWETTPDGREGFQNIFLRKNFSVYLIDQPRRGNAARSTVEATITPTPDEQGWFGTFRIGIWPNYFEGVQFAKDTATLNQYFRQMVPNVGPIDINVNAEAVSALFNKIGEGILVTHSHSGGMGWRTAIKNQNVKAIVSYEPGSGFLFPEGEVPAAMPSAGGTLEAVGVPMSEFIKLTKIPIVIYYGDNIAKEPTNAPGPDGWRVRLAMARKWRDAVNKYGGDVTVVHLPEAGLKGNTHFPFSDLNNVEIAELMSKWLHEKKLD
jgi:hypothetical protein